MFDITTLKFDKDGLIPAIVQDHVNGEVLMMALMNAVSLTKTIETGLCHYWSRSRQKLWLKGETSGNTQTVKEIFHDCDNDCLLIKVEQKTAACHTGHRSCFFTKVEADGTSDAGVKVFDAADVYSGSDILDKIYAVIMDRKANLPSGSYTAKLIKGGHKKLLGKVTEESGEFIAAVKGGKANEIMHEAADLWYHTLVALAVSGVTPSEVYEELKRRRK